MAQNVNDAVEEVTLMSSKLSVNDQNLEVHSTLLGLPTELRTAIAEYLFDRHQTPISVSFSSTQKQPCLNDTYALLRTCKQIHDECKTIPYEVNTVFIHAPIWNIHEDARQRDAAASGLRDFALQQATKTQVRYATLMLGTLPMTLEKLKWMDFMRTWLIVRDAIVQLRNCTRDLSLEIVLYTNTDSRVCRLHMCANSIERFEDTFKSYDQYRGSLVELPDASNEKLRKIKATIAKTLFETIAG